MNYFPPPNVEERTRWRNAAEVHAAALEHEKRRHQMYQEASFEKPQVINKSRRPSGWIAILQSALLFLISK